jgi:hypothetical protein
MSRITVTVSGRPPHEAVALAVRPGTGIDALKRDLEARLGAPIAHVSRTQRCAAAAAAAAAAADAPSPTALFSVAAPHST